MQIPFLSLMRIRDDDDGRDARVNSQLAAVRVACCRGWSGNLDGFAMTEMGTIPR